MPQDPLADAIWQALQTSHRHLALRVGKASRYPAAVAPFAAVEDHSQNALNDLTGLLSPGESVYVMGHRPPDTPNLRCDGMVACLQMVFRDAAALPRESRSAEIEPLDCSRAAEMLDLINLAFPGYFRPETCRMGRYYGIRDPQGRLIAMGGERLVLTAPDQTSWPEVSGLCSHPDAAGRGLGTAIIRRILAVHRAEGSTSWLHVADTNHRAIDLYLRLGFQTLRRVELHRMKRVD